jgi:hypothetical protein
MPMHFNASKSNQIGFGFQNHPVDFQLLSLIHSNFGLNQNEQLIFPTINHPIIPSSLGQLGLGQRVTELRRTYVTPRVVDYNIPLLQNQASIPVAEITSVTEIVRTEEVVRTHLLTATSTRDRIFIPNDHEIHIQGQPIFQNQILPMPNELNHSFSYQMDPFQDHHFQNPIHFQNPSENQPLMRNMINLQNLQLNSESNSNPLKVLIPGNTKSTTSDDDDHHHEDETDDDHDQDDGRTHSLPYKKYGPYTCPKCRGVFYTSQSFAAHMGSHYKHESSDERRRRQEAKNKRKNLRLGQFGGGLTALPVSFKTPGKRNGGRRSVHKKPVEIDQEKDDDDEVERKEEASPPELAAEEGLIDFQIKEEPVELIMY